MNPKSLRNYCRLHRGFFATIFLLSLAAGAIAAFFFLNWRPAAAFGSLALVVAALHYRTYQLLLKINASYLAREQGQHVGMESCLREALPLAEKLAPDDPVRGIVYHELACVTRLLGNYTDAEAFGLKAADVCEKAWGPEHPDTQAAVFALARTYLDIARYQQAKPLLDRVLASLEKAAKRQDLASCLTEHGRWWSEQGQYAAAEPYYRRAFEIVEQSSAAPADSIMIRLNFGMVCARLKRTDEAEAVVLAALEKVRKLAPAESLSIALCLDHLAFVRLLKGRVEEAERTQRQALAMTEKTAGPNMPTLSGGLTVLGGILKVQSKWPEAEECYRKALRLREEYLAPEHPTLAELLEDYADLLTLMGRSEEAEYHAQRAGHIRAFHSRIGEIGWPAGK